MYKNKKVLLIAGGGTLGTYTAEELLRLGAEVEVICPEEKVSKHSKLKFHQSLATNELLTELFSKTHYDGIVNFIHYPDPEKYKEAYRFLIKNTDHLIFLSSYRVYANEQHPVTESAPRLCDVVKDPDLLKYDTYGVSKGICEDFLFNECKGENWTVVRPVISFSCRRMDILMNSGLWAVEYAKSGKTMLLPLSCKELHAGLDWAGNSGKLIANLLFKKESLGEAFTICSGHGMTWGEIADAYNKVIGLKVEWVDDERYIDTIPTIRSNGEHNWMWNYDRKFDRDVDCSKVLTVTGLSRDDFTTIENGIKAEMKILKRSQK